MGVGGSVTDQQPNYGWRILKISPQSPCGRVSPPLVPYMDYVIQVNGKQLVRRPRFTLRSGTEASFSPREIVLLDPKCGLYSYVIS